MKICSHCGRNLSNEAKFCNGCGKSVVQSAGHNDDVDGSYIMTELLRPGLSLLFSILYLVYALI